MSIANKPPAVPGHIPAVIVSRESLKEAMSMTWDELMALSESGREDIKVVQAASVDGQLNCLRPQAGFASIRKCEAGVLKGRPILFEQNW